MKVLIAGGDRRVLLLSALMEQDGEDVHTLGLRKGDEADANADKVDLLLLPYPFAVKEGRIPTITGLELEADEVLKHAGKNAVIIGGNGLKTEGMYDYTHSEAFMQRNAAISAEAAVYEVMQRSEKAFMDLKLLITGYGRFARELALRLHLLGARVWVAARRAVQRDAAALDGMQPLSIDSLSSAMPPVDMVLNTVPAQILNKAALARLRPGTWMLEMASAPYGFDRSTAEEMGLRTALLPALPARYAPLSAAKALQLAVNDVLKEAGR